MKNLKENATMQEMSSEEQKDINGGSGTAIAIALFVLAYWPDIKKAASDAWNDR